jgi:hypothetical protein
MFKEILDYIKISLKQRIWDGVDWINLAVDRFHLRNSCEDGKHMFHRDSIIF